MIPHYLKPKSSAVCLSLYSVCLSIRLQSSCSWFGFLRGWGCQIQQKAACVVGMEEAGARSKFIKPKQKKELIVPARVCPKTLQEINGIPSSYHLS